MKFLDRFKRSGDEADPAAEADRVAHDAGHVEKDAPIETADREIPSVNARRRGGKVTGLLGLVFIGSVGLYLIYQLNTGESRKQQLAKKHDQEMAKANAVNGTLPPLVVPDRPPEPQVSDAAAVGNVQRTGGMPAPDQPPPPNEVTNPNGQGAGANQNGGQRPPSPWELMRKRRMQGALTVAFENEVSAAAPAAGGSAAPGQVQGVPLQGTPTMPGLNGMPGSMPGGASGDASAGAGPDQLAAQLQPTITNGTFATKLADRNFMITKGAFMDCVLETRLDSTVPGMTTCVLSRPMYSANRKVMLLDAGSKVVGQYMGGLKQGQARIFVLWTRIETPQGVLINLDSPGTDSLGASGLDGHVDNHFWQRFGGALMLSVIDDAFAVAAARSASNSGTTINFANTQAATQNMAAEALKSTIQIPPTLIKNQGDQINIFVARDLDFRTVYGLRAQ